MHKDEASLGFKILSDSDNVKIAKMLYVHNSLTYDDLNDIMGIGKEKLNDSLNIMINGNLVNKINDNLFSINKEYVDQLLDFIKTPCGCTKK